MNQNNDPGRPSRLSEIVGIDRLIGYLKGWLVVYAID